jgi:hypothetical protein
MSNAGNDKQSLSPAPLPKERDSSLGDERESLFQGEQGRDYLDEEDDFVSLRAWAVVGGLVILICVSLVFAATLLPIFGGILFPPAPPLPPEAVQLSHVQQAHGDDEWQYSMGVSACDVEPFYSAIGTCDVLLPCDARTTLPTNTVAVVCEGQQTFSIFSARWQAILRVGNEPHLTEIDLSRRVLWTGQ